MSVATILLPLFVQVALTFVVLFMTARSRIAAYKARQVNVAEVAVNPTAWPVHVQQIANCYNNQFQLPVLFYVLTILAMVTRHADVIFVVLAWLFVISRIVHAYIHCTSNYMRHRFNAFAVGFFILLAMWAIFAVEILLGLP